MEYWDTPGSVLEGTTHNWPLPHDLQGLLKAAKDAHDCRTNREYYIQNKAKGIVEHLEGFVNGSEKSFSRYFVTTDEHHAELESQMLSMITDKFGLPDTWEDPNDIRVAKLTYPDRSLALILRRDYSEEGVLVGTNYEANVLPIKSQVMLGKIASAIAMD